MNASALLQRQGWRGKGHTLHATDNSIGLANPLLLSRNTDGSGIGANKQLTDQWWLNAFDEKLKGLDTSKKGVVVQSVTKGHLDIISSGRKGKYSGLYMSFVRGGLMEGTLSPPDGESTDATPVSSSGDDRKGVSRGRGVGSSRAERRAEKTAKAERKAARAAEKKRKEELEKTKEKATGTETKEERRARKEESRARKEARRKRREEKAVRKAG